MNIKPSIIGTPAGIHPTAVEPFASINEAALVLGLPVHLLQRCARKKLFPSYRIDRRIRVRISEVLLAIESFKQGVAQ